MPDDLKLIEQLFRQYYRILRAYAYRLVNNTEAAEDIVQDVFVALWNNRSTLDEQTVKSYLFRSVHNRSVNYLSRDKGSQSDSLDSVVDYLKVADSDVALQENMFMADELRNEIHSFTENLPPQARRVFELSRMRGLKVAEIAKIMDIAPKTVANYLYKVLVDHKAHLHAKGFIELFMFFYVCCDFFCKKSLV